MYVYVSSFEEGDIKLSFYAFSFLFEDLISCPETTKKCSFIFSKVFTASSSPAIWKRLECAGGRGLTTASLGVWPALLALHTGLCSVVSPLHRPPHVCPLRPSCCSAGPITGQHHTGSYYQLLYPGNPQVSLHASVAPSWLKGHCFGGHVSGQNCESSPSSAADGPSGLWLR